MTATPPSLDHLILFTPTPTIPTAFASFTPTPGGTHADNLTANTLILLADGCYIELIHFVPSAPPAAVESHWWGPSRPAAPGWKDWCLTTTTPSTSSAAPDQTHIAPTTSHAPPVSGARQRADGVTVKWTVTFPLGAHGGQRDRGRVPFFCHDVTPRSLRVPLEERATAHACGAVGVGELSVVVRDRGMWDETKKAWEGVFGAAGREDDGVVVFEARRVMGVEGVPAPRVLLRVARDAEHGLINEAGFWVGDVVLFARAGEKRGEKRGERVKLDDGEEGVGGLWVEYV
jgi:hypothetical protein